MSVIRGIDDVAAPSFLSDFPRVSGRAAPGPGTLRVRTVLQPAYPRLARGRQGFAGSVKVILAPAPTRIVRLYERASGRLVRETLTTLAGLYSFPEVTDTWSYYVVALDNMPGGYNAAIADDVTPT